MDCRHTLVNSLCGNLHRIYMERLSVLAGNHYSRHMEKQKILIVEDEPAILTGLVDVFVFHGFDVTSASTGDQGLTQALTGKFDLLLLDVMLPGVDGFEICRRVREGDKQQAIIMLTAKSGDDEIIHGLQLGADDYVAKPFSVTQLLLRVKAVLRRTSPEAPVISTITLSEGLAIQCDQLLAIVSGESVALTKREVQVLHYLAAQSPRAVPREELLNKVWGYAQEHDIETRTVDIHIAKIRRKIEADPKNPQFLLTLRGAGYQLKVKDES
jgi:DNA-binding response OmpR family regulator